MSICLMVGASLLALSDRSFTLDWQHSVEKTRWRESWQVTADGLHLTEAAVKGSGAGMEPGEGAHLQGGWWVWAPDLDPLPNLSLATSGATGAGWHLCSGEICHDIPETGATVVLRPCTEEEWRKGSGP
ncbi:MAG: DUF1850 domain-containing protein [Cypionkella sp.]|uniref:DUF1850 domain-containing protein n=1 Tax=Cypionkella sp. TaxID=2811411 RepID=UPI002ABC8458|nr:DUF1850 domain-containing protein [Cypionkella sp.]MDZ4309502.1 DUF1850 domain-containing protein [Cypionkella sp.]MDZ4392885.1 DUF1850 domain-containing protein [Cypionkella sp.]